MDNVYSWDLTSFSKNLSSSVFSPGLVPAPANTAAYSYVGWGERGVGDGGRKRGGGWGEYRGCVSQRPKRGEWMERLRLTG